MNRIFQSVGIVITAAGLVLLVLSFIVKDMDFISFPTAIILIITGFIIFITNRFVWNMLKGFPQTKGFSTSLKDGTAKINSATEFLKHYNKSSKLASEGIPVKVKIIGFKDTGQLVNYDPVIEFQLEVLKEHKYDNYYINSHKQIISKILLNRIQTGKEYYAKLDPEDKNNVLLSIN